MEEIKVLGRKNSIVPQIKGDRKLQTATTSEKIAYLYMPTAEEQQEGTSEKKGDNSAPFC